MGRSISRPARLPAGTLRHPLSSTTELTSSGAVHRLRVGELMAEYPLAWTVGSGQVGQSFLVQVGRLLIQSPGSYYSRREKWDWTPGYQHERRVDFDDPVTPGCLFCHVGKPAPAAIGLIGCDRCHGPGEAHRRRPSASNIVNPAKLPERARDSICEQCHLQGAATILNPGRDWWDFQPGQLWERIATTYVTAGRGGSAAPKAVSHIEQLAQSACARQSGGKLWCGTCHHPHGEKQGSERVREVREICQSCHGAQLSVRHPTNAENCAACHMPQRGVADVAHAAVSDHRIRRFLVEMDVPTGGSELQAWREPAAEWRQRNLGLAYLTGVPAPAAVANGYRLLSEAYRAGQGDGPVLVGLASVLASQRQFVPAIRLLTRAGELEPLNADYALALGRAEAAAGHQSQAVAAFERAIALRPEQVEIHVALAAVYRQVGQEVTRRRVLERGLRVVPQSIRLRAALRE